MITKVRVKNFKCFGESGGDFELAPLTFLFGDNSAGKSTVLQALSTVAATVRDPEGQAFFDICRRRNDESGLSIATPLGEFRTKVFRHQESLPIDIWFRASIDDGQKVLHKTRFTADGTAIIRKTTTDPNSMQSRMEVFLNDNFTHSEALRPTTNSGSRSKGYERVLQDAVFAMSPEDKNSVNDMLEQLSVGYRIVDRITLHDTVFDVDVPIEHVGVGIHGMVDVLQSLAALRPQGVLALEEPEVHLHPRQLGPLVEVIAQRVLHSAGSQAIVECHSQHMVLKMVNLILKGSVRPDDVRVLYIQRRHEGSNVVPVTIAANGDVTGWPGGFFPELGDLIAEGLT